MDTIELTVYVRGMWQELLIAELDDLDFNGFVQDDNALKAYVPASQWAEDKRAYVEEWLRARDLTVPFEERVIGSQHWNQRWEETIRPIAVGPFLIKPTWAAVPEAHRDKILVEIDPKMSFGTGYHESTRLVLRFLPDLVKPGHHVLDAGSGTGILAIAAVLLGATDAVAFDVDPWSQRNAVENFILNRVDRQIAFRNGSIDQIVAEGFDLVLANINRGVLLDLLPAFAQKMAPSGHLVLAGLLREDRAGMLQAASEEGLAPVQENTEGAWWAVVLAKG